MNRYITPGLSRPVRSYPASEKQITFIRRLLAEREGNEIAEQLRAGLNVVRERNCLTSKVASAVIDELLAIKVDRHANADRTTKDPLEDGMYRDPSSSTIYKVYHTVQGANVQVAKKLVEEADGGWSFEYQGRRPLHGLRPEMRMTIEQAKEFGAIYGVCCVCSRTLTDERSIAAGIGPVCGGRI